MSSSPEAHAKYNRSEKGKARQRRYARTEKGRARVRRYQETHFELRVGHDKEYIGTYPVTPEQRKTIQGFRAKQREEINGRLNTAIA